MNVNFALSECLSPKKFNGRRKKQKATDRTLAALREGLYLLDHGAKGFFPISIRRVCNGANIQKGSESL